jgi:hypothetical protein
MRSQFVGINSYTQDATGIPDDELAESLGTFEEQPGFNRFAQDSQTLQPRPRIQTGSPAIRWVTDPKLSESKSKPSMTDVRQKAMREYLKSTKGQHKDIMSAHVSMRRAYTDRSDDLLNYAYADSGKLSVSGFGYNTPATPRIRRGLFDLDNLVIVHDRNTTRWPKFDDLLPQLEPLPRSSLQRIHEDLSKAAASSGTASSVREESGRDYAAFNTEHGSQQGPDIPPGMQTGSRSEPRIFASTFKSSYLSGSPMPEPQPGGPEERMRLRHGFPAPNLRTSFPSPSSSPSPPPISLPHYPEAGYLSRTDLPEGPNVNNQHTTPGYTPSDMFQIGKIDGRDNYSATFPRSRICSSAYRFYREKLKYTISEDRTMNASNRDRACFSALEQSSTKITFRNQSADTTDQKLQDKHLNTHSRTFSCGHVDCLGVEAFANEGNLIKHNVEIHANEDRKKHGRQWYA